MNLKAAGPQTRSHPVEAVVVQEEYALYRQGASLGELNWAIPETIAVALGPLPVP